MEFWMGFAGTMTKRSLFLLTSIIIIIILITLFLLLPRLFPSWDMGDKTLSKTKENITLLYHRAKETGNWQILYDEAVAAHERYKKDEFLTAVCVYSSLRTGRLEEAARGAKGLQDPRFKDLQREILLRNNLSLPGDFQEDKELSWLFSKEPEDFLRFAHLHSDPAVIKNLAALWMYHGNPEKAFDLIPGISDPETAFKVAFFAGRFAKAYDFLKYLDLENPEVKLMQADLQWFSFDKIEARKTNSEIITDYQGFSWIPYHNLGWLMEGEKQIALFSEGVSCFPENEDLFRALVLALYEQGQVDEAERLMRDKMNYQGPDPLLTLLLREKLRGDETFKMFLWTIISDYPGIPWLSRYLGVYLLGRHDFDSLEFLLSRHDDDKQVWVPFLTAVVEASRGNAGEGDGGFIRSIALEEKWEAVANRGIIALASRKEHEAYDYFHKALSMVPENNGKNRSKIHFLMAKTLNRQGLTEDALEELFLSLTDDPLNQQAILLRKQLDDRY